MGYFCLAGRRVYALAFRRMKRVSGTYPIVFAFVAIALAVVPKAALAQTDEIQVYDAEVADPGKVNVMVHSNYTPIGRKTADFPGGIIPNHSVNGAVEWAFGVKDWFEQGLYFPVYTIVGLHLHKVDLIYNPIMDTDYKGGFGNLEYVPAGRVAYNVNDKWAVSLEEYADMGPLRQFDPAHDQFHEIWAVLNHDSKIMSIETGVGVGVTHGADRLTFKLMLSRDLN